jgi:hypothetical protein
MVPIDSISDLLNKIKEDASALPRIDEFISYFNDFYIEGPFKPAICNQFDVDC